MVAKHFKVIIVFLIILVVTQYACTSLQAEPTSGGPRFSVKKFQAWARFRDGDFNEALLRYKELNTATPNNAFFNYMLGRCYFSMDKFDEAISYFETTRRIDPKVKSDLPFYAGVAYHKKGDLDNALKYYNDYISNLTPRQLERDELVADLVKSCMRAKEMKTNPVNVVITKLGKNINSDYDDASPGLTPDGKSLIFTSRRTTEGIEKLDIDVNPFNDKMYIAHWDESINNWGKAQPVEGDINFIGHIGSLSLSHDGKTMFIFKNIPEETASGDIFFSELLSDGKWSKPASIGKPVNTSYFESSACLSPDGSMLFFVSENKGGFGNADIYRSHRLAANKWSTPENLKGVVNSPYDELGVYMHPDGKTLYFSSNGHSTMGGYDIFMSKLDEGVWSQPVNMGYPINSEFDEKHFVLSADGKTAYISSNRDGVYDIYSVNMTAYGSKEPVKVITQYVNDSGAPSGDKTSAQKAVETKTETEITVFNEKTNQRIAVFSSSNSGGDYVLKLKSNETYAISFKNKSDQKSIAYIKTTESGEYQLKISNNETFLVSVEKSWKQALLRIKLIEN